MGIYRIADINVKIDFLCEDTKSIFKDYLITSDSVVDLNISISREQLEFEMQFVSGLPLRSYENVAILRVFTEAVSEKYNGMFFHASAVAVDDEAYLFTAPSGTGKSTHTRLWRKLFGDRAIMVNDDKPIIRCIDGVPYVYGTPWNGKHNLSTNMRAPIKAICILHQDEKNSISYISKIKALPRLMEQTVIPTTAQGYDKMFNLFENIFDKVIIAEMGCNVSLDAAQMSYDFFKKAERK